MPPAPLKQQPVPGVWLSDEERDRLLDGISALAEERAIKSGGPIVFEGNAPPTSATTPRCERSSRKRPWISPMSRAHGSARQIQSRAPRNRIPPPKWQQPPRRRPARGSRPAILGLSLVALGAQYPAGQARFIFFQGATDGQGPLFIESISKAVPHTVTIVTPHEAPAAMNEIAAELNSG